MIPIPYDSISELPEQVRDNASEQCQRVFLEAYNSAESSDEYENDEETLFQVAWGAMTNVCSKDNSEGDEYTEDPEHQGNRTESSADQRETTVRGRYVDREEIQAADDPTAGPWTFGGIAVADGDILHMEDGTPVVMQAEHLATADFAPAADKLTVDHPEYEGQSPPVRETVGSVPEKTFDDSAIWYKAETHDEKIAAGVHAGSYDVSVHATFELGDEDPETGAYIAENITFHDLSVVSLGDSPSNTAEWGAPAALASRVYAGAGADAVFSDPSSEEEEEASTSAPPPGVRQWLADTLGLSLPGRSDAQAADETAESVEGDDSGPGQTESDPDPEPDMTETNDPDDEEPEQAPADPGDGENDEQTPEEPTTDTNTVEVDLGDHDSLEDLIDARVSEQVEASREEITKKEQVDEIIAHSDDYSEDDREDLLASPASVVEKTHKSATATSAAPIPGLTSQRDEAAASIGENDGDNDLDAFGTGVSN